MANQEKVFAKGFNFKRSDSAPEWLVGKVSINVPQFIVFLNANKDGEWVNLKVAQGKQGNYYAELDTWKPSPQQKAEAPQPKLTPPSPSPNPFNDNDVLPF